MYSPDVSQHTPRLYQLGKHYGIPMTEVADRLIRHGLQNLETVFEWQPGMGRACVAEVVARIEPPPVVEKSA
ncbi:MAG: hypothetical protein HZA93_08770 [Verrucomicrobia bacterium]|nr:hypothetical protein [Verrucomicrobiota bacterium]